MSVRIRSSARAQIVILALAVGASTLQAQAHSVRYAVESRTRDVSVSKVLTLEEKGRISLQADLASKEDGKHSVLTVLQAVRGQWSLSYSFDGTQMISGLTLDDLHKGPIRSGPPDPGEILQPVEDEIASFVQHAQNVVDTTVQQANEFINDNVTHAMEMALLLAGKLLPTETDSLGGCMLCNAGKVLIIAGAAACAYVGFTSSPLNAAQCAGAETTLWESTDEFCARVKCNPLDWDCADAIELVPSDLSDFEIWADTSCSKDVTIGMSPINVWEIDPTTGQEINAFLLPGNMCPLTNACRNDWWAFVAPGTCWIAKFGSQSTDGKKFDAGRRWVTSNKFCVPLDDPIH